MSKAQRSSLSRWTISKSYIYWEKMSPWIHTHIYSSGQQSRVQQHEVVLDKECFLTGFWVGNVQVDYCHTTPGIQSLETQGLWKPSWNLYLVSSLTFRVLHFSKFRLDVQTNPSTFDVSHLGLREKREERLGMKTCIRTKARVS